VDDLGCTTFGEDILLAFWVLAGCFLRLISLDIPKRFVFGEYDLGLDEIGICTKYNSSIFHVRLSLEF